MATVVRFMISIMTGIRNAAMRLARIALSVRSELAASNRRALMLDAIEGTNHADAREPLSHDQVEAIQLGLHQAE